MGKDFDFNRVEKRMPYKTPDNFFNEMEENVWKEIQRGSPKASRRKAFRSRILAGALIAASMALLLALNPFSRDERTDGFSKVEQAFANLSREDQAYMLEVYREDLFMNE